MRSRRLSAAALVILLASLVALSLPDSSGREVKVAADVARPVPVHARWPHYPTTTTEAPVVVTEAPSAPARRSSAPPPAATVPRAERPQSFTDSGFPADCIGHYESGNDYGESGGGRFQIIHSTWAGYDGYSDAEDAPASVQDAKAAQLWAENGHAHWAAQRGRCF